MQIAFISIKYLVSKNSGSSWKVVLELSSLNHNNLNGINYVCRRVNLRHLDVMLLCKFLNPNRNSCVINVFHALM